MLKFAILTILFVPSILAALSLKEMASALIAAEDSETLEETFKTFEKEQDAYDLSFALADVAEQGHQEIVATCLRMAHGPFPDENSHVSYLVHGTLCEISDSTDSGSFANVITSFKPSDVKPLASIRYWTFMREDDMSVLKSFVTKSPELITDDLPSWIACHQFANMWSTGALKYLTSLATESVLAKALSIPKKNEHYTMAYKSGITTVFCCEDQDDVPRDLADRIEGLLNLAKARNAVIREASTFLSKVLIDLMLDYAPN